MVELFAALPRPLTTLRKAGAIGDSITAEAYGISGVNSYWQNAGYLTWVRQLLGDRIDLPASRVYALAGATIDDVVNTHLPAALAGDLDICFVHFGINSIDGTNTASKITKVTGVYDSLIANGTFVVAIPIRMTRGAYEKTGDELLQLCAINNAIVEYARGKAGILVVDPNPTIIDFATGIARSDYLRDGLHDNPASAKALGTLVANAISALLPARVDRFALLGDVYHATKNPRGNLLPNGLMDGTGGAAFNGVTGNVANYWAAFRNNDAGTLTVAASKVANAAGTNLYKQRLTFGGTADSNDARLLNSVLIGANLAVGDVVYAECELDYNLTAANIPAVALRLSAEADDYSLLRAYYDAGSASLALPAGTGSLILRTEPMTIPLTTHHVNFDIVFNAPASGTPTAVIDVGRCSLRKVL